MKTAAFVSAGKLALVVVLLLAVGTSQAAGDNEFNELVEVGSRAYALRIAGRGREALPLADRLVARAADVFRGHPTNLSASFETAGHIYWDQGLYAKAEPFLKRALAIREKAWGAEHRDVATSLNDLGVLCFDQSRYAEAEPLLKRALAIREKVLGAEDSEVAGTLNNLASLYKDQGRYVEAEPLLKRALAVHEKALGAEHPDVAGSLHNLANLYKDQGRYAESEALYKRALAIREKALGAMHRDVGINVNNLAILNEYQGRFVEAEALYKRALAIWEKTLGAEHPYVGTSLNNLATLNANQGRYAEAEAMYKRALAIREKSLGAEHRDVADSLNNLATLYQAQGRYAEAAALYKRALVIREKALGAEHRAVATALGNLAGLLAAQSDYVQAESLYQRALTIYEKSLGAEHPSVAHALVGLVHVFVEQGRYAEAEDLADRLVILRDRAMVAPQERYMAYFLRAGIAWHEQRKTDAIADLNRALDLAEQARGQASGSELERAEHFSSFTDAFETMVAWQSELGDVGQAISAIERSRARSLLDDMRSSGADLDAGRSAAERNASRQREAELKSKIAQLEKQGGQQEVLSEAKSQLYEHYRQQRSASPVYRNLLAVGSVPPQLRQLQRALVGNDGLMLIYLMGSKASYVAIIEEKKARIHRLEIAPEEAEKLGIKPGALTAAGLRPVFVNDSKSGLLQQLRNPLEADKATAKLAALWKVLIPAVEREALTSGRFKRLIVVPDGPLALLPFDTLVVTEGESPKYLLDAGPPIEYAPSATVLFNLASKRSAAPANQVAPVLTVGGILYGGNNPGATASKPDQLAARSRYRAGGGQLAPLPFTNWEVAWVTEVCTKAGWKSLPLLAGAATEAAVRTDVPGRKIVHLACHGLVDQSYGNLFGALALTPGARAASDPADDGFLTLAEICQLDLKSCELAVLSACDTNYGPQQQGEGTWALSRGFLVAGAKRVVATNWLVDDEAAATLVSLLCGEAAKGEASGTTDYATALQTAKRWVRKQEKWRSPYYWGTFVLVGPN